jgi:hypothetical protein
VRKLVSYTKGRVYNTECSGEYLDLSGRKLREAGENCVMCSLRMRWAGHVVCMEEIKYAYRIFIGKPAGKTKA